MSDEESRVQSGLSWVQATSEKIPSNVIDAGRSTYIVRVKHLESTIPGMFNSEVRKALFTWNGTVHEAKEFEILCDTGLPIFGISYQWIKAFSGQVPPSALVAGCKANRERFYVARINYGKKILCGKVESSKREASFSRSGQNSQEYRTTNYEVLCLKQH